MVSHALQTFDGAGAITTVPVRDVVHDFALAMEEQLLLNDHKGGWRNEELHWLLRRCREELVELEDALRSRRPVAEVLGEAADVGNFAMMIADVYAHDQVDVEPAPAAAATPAPPTPDLDDVVVRVLADVPPFQDHLGRVVKLSAGDIASVAAGTARVLYRRGKAQPAEVAA